jgi:hypothetical protein
VVAVGRPAGATLEVIELRTEEARGEFENRLSQSGSEIQRVTAVLRLHDYPLALFWSFLSARDVSWASELKEGETVPIDRLHSELLLAEGSCVVETSWATDFESSCLDTPSGDPILVAHCTEIGHFTTGPELRTVEVAWVMCRADATRVRIAMGMAGAPATTGKTERR